MLSYLNSTDTLSSEQVILNYIYWGLLIIVINNHKDYLSLHSICLGIGRGIILAVLFYHVLQNIGFTVLPFLKPMPQNAYSFLLICYAPLTVYIVIKRGGFASAIVLSVVLIISAFLSGSRAGSVLVSLGVILTFIITLNGGRYLVSYTLIGSFILTIIIETSFFQSIIFSLNERTFKLIYMTEEVLGTDRSYLVRKAMVEKGLEIYEEYPIYGVGLNNFRNYSVDIPGEFIGSKYVINKAKLMQTSSHNSYINLLAEGGLVLFVPFIAILLSIIIYGIWKFRRLNEIQRVFLVSVICMSIHLYFITAIVNIFAWFLIATTIAALTKKEISK